jgi:hypothetical protein
MSAENPTERYSAMDTLAINQQIYLEKGTKLYSNLAVQLPLFMMITVGAMTPLAVPVHVKVIRFAMHMKPTQCIVAVTILCMPWQTPDCKKAWFKCPSYRSKH